MSSILHARVLCRHSPAEVIDSQQAGTMEHRYDPINPLQFFPRDVQPEVEGLGELRSDLLARSGCYMRVRFKEDL